MLRRMEDDQRSEEDALEGVRELVEDIEESDSEATREGAAVSR
jgi:hypothetical protein